MRLIARAIKSSLKKEAERTRPLPWILAGGSREAGHYRLLFEEPAGRLAATHAHDAGCRHDCSESNQRLACSGAGRTVIEVERQPSKKGTSFEQPLTAHQRWHIDVSYINIGGTFYYLCSIPDGCSRYIVNWDLRKSKPGAIVLGGLAILQEHEPSGTRQRQPNTAGKL